MAEINHSIGIKGSVDEVYAAIATREGVAQWWTGDVRGESKVGGKLHFVFGDDGPEVIVSDLKPGKRVAWLCKDAGPDWSGTEISFDLEKDEKQVYVRFRHSGWKEAGDHLAHCSTRWAVFLLSLKDLLEKGEGRPFPNDIQINHD